MAATPDPAFVEAARLWREFYRTHPPFFAERGPDGRWRIFGWTEPNEDAANAILPARNETAARDTAREMCERALQ